IGDVVGVLPDQLRSRARLTPDAVLVDVDGTALTCQQLESDAAAVASGLVRLGVGSGDRVAFLCENCAELVQLLFATWSVGATAVPLNVFLRGSALQHQLIDSGSTTVLTDDARLDTLRQAIDESSATAIDRIVTIGVESTDSWPGITTLPFAELI